MYSDREIAAIVSTLRRFPELNGCVIGYVGDNECRVVADGDPRSPLSPCVAVVIEEVNVDPGEAAQLSDLSQSPSGTQNLPDIVTNQSRIAPELVGAGISCGLTIASAFGVLAGAAAEVPTGGASTFLVVVAWTGWPRAESSASMGSCGSARYSPGQKTIHCSAGTRTSATQWRSSSSMG